MKITSITDQLVSQMVKSTVGLRQQNRDNTTNRGSINTLRERPIPRPTETNRMASPSSAYRVTLSPAALQKMSAGGT